MLDAFYIFTKGGLVLFSFLLAPLRGEPVEALIRTCLLEERAGDEAFTYAADAASYALKWAFHNEAALVFVAVRTHAARGQLARAHGCMDGWVCAGVCERCALRVCAFCCFRWP
jgi:hypothetical protein